MKLNKKIKILMLLLTGICIGTTFSNAAIEIKPGTTAHTNISLDTAYHYCQDMVAFSSSLGANSLDPHLSTHKDWAAAAYLGLSGYGYIRSAYGQEVTIDGTLYNSTTKNATGVMNMGKTCTQVANCYSNTTTWLVNERNTKYVDIISETQTDNMGGLAMYETYWWFYPPVAGLNYPPNTTIVRIGCIGYSDHVNGNAYENAVANPNVTYRPVIWN